MLQIFMISSTAMVTFVIKQCKRLDMKFKMADICKKTTSLANFELTTLIQDTTKLDAGRNMHSTITFRRNKH